METAVLSKRVYGSAGCKLQNEMSRGSQLETSSYFQKASLISQWKWKWNEFLFCCVVAIHQRYARVRSTRHCCIFLWSECVKREMELKAEMEFKRYFHLRKKIQRECRLTMRIGWSSTWWKPISVGMVWRLKFQPSPAWRRYVNAWYLHISRHSQFSHNLHALQTHLKYLKKYTF